MLPDSLKPEYIQFFIYRNQSREAANPHILEPRTCEFLLKKKKEKKKKKKRLNYSNSCQVIFWWSAFNVVSAH